MLAISTLFGYFWCCISKWDKPCFNRHRKDSHTPEEIASAEYIEKESARQAKDAKERERAMTRVRKTMSNLGGYVWYCACDRVVDSDRDVDRVSDRAEEAKERGKERGKTVLFHHHQLHVLGERRPPSLSQGMCLC